MIVGIDLGTTNSLIAVLEGREPRLIPNGLGEFLTPSVVGIDDDGEVLVGKPAGELQVTAPERCASVFKRLIGSDETVEVAGRKYNAIQLSAFVLKSLASDALREGGQAIEGAVITVPAYFNEPQRSATIQAGEMAGLNVLRIINEPTAAALAYGLNELSKERLVLVYDLGGGTFDVSIVDQFESTLQIKASAGEVFLGGEDFTKALASFILNQQGQSFEHQEHSNPKQIARLLWECEQAKRRLTTKPVANVRIPNKDGAFSEASETVPVRREDFHRSTESLLHRTLAPLRRALNDCGVSATDLDEVILVGGATRMACICDEVSKTLDCSPLISIDPDHVVALGAAVQAGLTERQADVEDMMVTDVCPFTLGVEIAKDLGGRIQTGYFTPVISRNTTIPVSRVEEFGTISPNQRQVELSLYQGESRRVENNTLLGKMVLKGIPRGPAGQQISVRFTYDLNGVIEVEATVAATGRKISHVITRHASGLSRSQVRKAVAEMEQLKIHPASEQKNRYLLKKADRVYQETPPFLRPSLDQLVTEFEAALNTQEPEIIEATRSQLEQFLKQLQDGFEGDVSDDRSEWGQTDD